MLSFSIFMKCLYFRDEAEGIKLFTPETAGQNRIKFFFFQARDEN